MGAGVGDADVGVDAGVGDAGAGVGDVGAGVGDAGAGVGAVGVGVGDGVPAQPVTSIATSARIVIITKYLFIFGLLFVSGLFSVSTRHCI